MFTMKRNYAAMTIAEALSHYAPVSDNNDPVTYSNYVAKKTGVSPGTDIKDLTEVQRVRFLDAMQVMEGYKEGKEIIL
jgi:hypothetical protein